jgi:hypothetical protein
MSLCITFGYFFLSPSIAFSLVLIGLFAGYKMGVPTATYVEQQHDGVGTEGLDISTTVDAPDKEKQSSLKRKREEDLSLKQTLSGDVKSLDDDNAFESGNDDSALDDDRCKDVKPDVTKKEAKASVAVKAKRDRTVRRQDRSNRSEKKWTIAMKRHWNTEQKDSAIALITIKRHQLQEVQSHQ